MKTKCCKCGKPAELSRSDDDGSNYVSWCWSCMEIHFQEGYEEARTGFKFGLDWMARQKRIN